MSLSRYAACLKIKVCEMESSQLWLAWVGSLIVVKNSSDDWDNSIFLVVNTFIENNTLSHLLPGNEAEINIMRYHILFSPYGRINKIAYANR